MVKRVTMTKQLGSPALQGAGEVNRGHSARSIIARDNLWIQMRGTGLPHEFTSKKIMAKLRLKVPGTWAGECEKKMGLNNKAEIELTIS